MIQKEITLTQYENCSECPLGEHPKDYKDGMIPLPRGGKLFITKTKMNKYGEMVPNDIVGRCGFTGKRLKKVKWDKGCSRWFSNGVHVNIDNL